MTLVEPIPYLSAAACNWLSVGVERELYCDSIWSLAIGEPDGTSGEPPLGLVGVGSGSGGFLQVILVEDVMPLTEVTVIVAEPSVRHLTELPDTVATLELLEESEKVLSLGFSGLKVIIALVDLPVSTVDSLRAILIPVTSLTKLNFPPGMSHSASAYKTTHATIPTTISNMRRLALVVLLTSPPAVRY